MIIIRTDAQSNRKALAGALSELFHEKPRYCGAPTFAYEFGVGRLARDASLRLVPSLNETAAERLAAALAERGFSCAVETVCSVSCCGWGSSARSTSAPAPCCFEVCRAAAPSAMEAHPTETEERP